MSLIKYSAVASALVLAFAFSAGAQAQAVNQNTNVGANVSVNQNINQTPQTGNLACRLNPRASACGPVPDQRTASGASRQGSSATQGGGPRPKRR